VTLQQGITTTWST